MGRLRQSEFNKYLTGIYVYGRRDHCQSEYDHKHSEPEICNLYVQKIKVISFIYTTELFYHGFHHKLQFCSSFKELN